MGLEPGYWVLHASLNRSVTPSWLGWDRQETNDWSCVFIGTSIYLFFWYCPKFLIAEIVRQLLSLNCRNILLLQG